MTDYIAQARRFVWLVMAAGFLVGLTIGIAVGAME